MPEWVDIWDDWKAVQGVADAKVTALEAQFANVVAKAGGKKLRANVENAIKQGNKPKVFDLVVESWRRKANLRKASLVKIITKAVVESGKLSAGKILDDPSAFRFDVTNPKASLYARDNVGTLIDNISEDQLKTVRIAIKEAMDKGLSSRSVANRVFSSVGLQSRQLAALQNFRLDLEGKGLTASRIKTLVNKKERVYRGLRAEAIARTESMRAANMGQQLLWEEAIEQGQLDPSRLVKKWIITPDDRLCDRCRAIGAKTVPIGQAFNGGGLTPPLHPLCRCAVGLVRGKAEAQRGNLTVEKQQPLAPSPAIGVKKKKPAGRRVRKRKIPDGVKKTAGKKAPSTLKGTSLEETYGKHVIGKDKNGNPIFTPERQALHDKIIEHQLAGPRDKKGKLIRRATAVDDPEVTVLGGGPASGKTVAKNNALKQFKNNAAPVDPDEIRSMLPEYKVVINEGSTEAAAITHKEASYLAKRAIREGQRRRLNIVADGTGDGDYDKFVKKIGGYRDRGATRLVGNYVTIETDEAMVRMLGRAKKSGRYVPERVLRETHKGVSEVFPRAIADDLFDEARLWDNNSPAGVDPKLIARWKRGGELEILDHKLYEQFRAKARETVKAKYPKPKRRFTPIKRVKKPPVTEQGSSLEPTWDRHVLGIDPDGNPVFTPERQALHKEIMEQQLAGARDKKGKLIREATAVDNPEMVVLGGGPASGKTVANQAAMKGFKNNAAPVDPDEIRGMFPEYKLLVEEGSSEAAGITHKEASFLAKSIIKEGQSRKLNIIADGTGDGDYDEFVARIAGYRKRGATRLVGNYVTIDTEEAMVRMLARAGKSGRYVPERVLRETHRGVSRVVPLAIDDELFDAFALWDNNIDGKPATLIARWEKGGKLEILDRPAYERFLSKAGETVGDSYPKPLRQSRLAAISNSGDRKISDLDGKVTRRKSLNVISSSEIILVQGKDFRGVFKPTSGDGFVGMRSTVKNTDFPLARREALAYQLDRRLGTNMVPDTKVRTIRAHRQEQGGPGSIQRFIEDAGSAAEIGFDPANIVVKRTRGKKPPARNYVDREKLNEVDLQRQFVLDLIIGNTDRHNGNFMIKVINGEKRVVSIDHGLSFPESTRIVNPDGGFVLDVLGLREFRNTTFDFVYSVAKSRGADINKRLAGQLLENMARLDMDDLLLDYGIGMNAKEKAALIARFRFVQRHLRKGDLLETMASSGYRGELGWVGPGSVVKPMGYESVQD